jgi:hypothetical protein
LFEPNRFLETRCCSNFSLRKSQGDTLRERHLQKTSDAWLKDH